MQRRKKRRHYAHTQGAFEREHGALVRKFLRNAQEMDSMQFSEEEEGSLFLEADEEEEREMDETVEAEAEAPEGPD